MVVEPKVGDTWYRLEDRLYAASLDEFERSVGEPTAGITVYECRVTKRTKKGVQVQLAIGTWLDPVKHFVLLSANKHYACPTLEAAEVSFLARKSRQIGILEARLRRAHQASGIVLAGMYQKPQAATPPASDDDLLLL